MIHTADPASIQLARLFQSTYPTNGDADPIDSELIAAGLSWAVEL